MLVSRSLFKKFVFFILVFFPTLLLLFEVVMGGILAVAEGRSFAFILSRRRALTIDYTRFRSN